MDAEGQSSGICDNLLFPKIFRTFRISVHHSQLIIAFFAVAIILLAGWLMDFSKTVTATAGTTTKPFDRAMANKTELQVYITNPEMVQPFIEALKKTGERVGVFSTLWHFTVGKIHSMINSIFELNVAALKQHVIDYCKAIRWALRYHPIYCAIFGLIKLAVMAIAGGAICRITGLQFARGEKPRLTEALCFSTKKFTSFFIAPLVPAGMIICIGLFILLLGVIGNIPIVGELLVGISMPAALIAGCLIAIVFIGTVAGFNMMFPAVAYDGSDCFDAVSRAFSYVYARPWKMGFYTAIAAVYGAICYMFVRLLVFLLFLATHIFLRLGLWAQNSENVNKLEAIWPRPTFMNLLSSPAATNWPEYVAALLTNLCLLAIVGLVLAFVISFYFSANTIIYSLMRNRVDNTALQDIYTDYEDTDAESAVMEQSRPED